jgi:hypothetical protein
VYYTVTIEAAPNKEAVPFSNKIKRYAVVLELLDHKLKLISLYRALSGEWIINLEELGIELRKELRRQIEVNEKSHR